MRPAVVLLALALFVACAQSPQAGKDYISAIPDPLDVSEYVKLAQEAPEFENPVDPSCGWEKLAIPGGTLIAPDGTRMKLEAGVLISNCKAEALVKAQSSAQRFYVERNQLALLYSNLNSGCVAAEQMLRRELAKYEAPGVWERYDFEVGLALGSVACVGTLYASAPAFD